MSTNKLSAEAAAVLAALVAQYIAPARVIGKKAQAMEKIKGDTWSAFKDASAIGLDAGHDAKTMATGISAACADQDVPQGTVNAYLPILRKLHTDCIADPTQRDALMALSIKDARAKYQPKKEAAKADAPKSDAPKTEAASESGDGGESSGMIGGTERSRTLAAINELLGQMDDEALAGVLAMLADEVAEAA